MLRYYLIAIFGAIALFTLLAVFAGGLVWWYALLGVFASAAAAFGIDALVALLVRRWPEEKIDPFNGFFTARPWERKLYVRLGVRRWKDRIPEMGGLLAHFPKDRVADLHDNVYLLKFLRETCYAEVMHLWSIPAGFLIFLLWPRRILWFGLPVALVNAFLQILPVITQRYVRPFLVSAYRRNEKSEARRQATESSNTNLA